MQGRHGLRATGLRPRRAQPAADLPLPKERVGKACLGKLGSAEARRLSRTVFHLAEWLPRSLAVCGVGSSVSRLVVVDGAVVGTVRCPEEGGIPRAVPLKHI